MVATFFSQYRDILVTGITAGAVVFGAGWRLHSSFARVHSRLDSQSASAKASSQELMSAVTLVTKEMRRLRGNIRLLNGRITSLDDKVSSVGLGLAELKGEVRGRLRTSKAE